ncbi:Protein CBG05179 [Caenorhabditis briggsae]|uniref:DM2 domain-containing protein n=2 Tax=Caenorhabditis briggsae TaxID=6238 RepID=A0AAE9ELA1_CAEBR|nr:Protein CBG05179 [Caenorhabditis briggsae]ULT99758.1 hypothetical protein L3Y34_000800 [Caenorhabditis briggsae]UMM22439.1 hypothetical protein L5515_003654 [Caenorhabditis briggsae]CAP25724.1 Protein CBG05179 [Caenorhabditis briggsae]
MAVVDPISPFPMDKEVAEEEIALLVRKPGFNDLTIVDIIRHMNNRFNTSFDSFKSQLKKMVLAEIAKKNQEDESSDSSDESGDDSDGEDKKETKDVKKEVKDESDDDEVDDPVVPKKRASKEETDMASNIKSTRRAAASDALKSIRTSAGGRFVKKSTKVKDPNADMSGKFGPMTKLCYISTELQQITKDQWMKRCDVVKVLWDYIKANNLKDPKNGQFIICDDVMRSIFNKNRFKGFGMAKFLTKHIIGTSDMAPDMREEAEAEMKKRRSEWLERQRLKEEVKDDESDEDDATEGPSAKKPKVEEDDEEKNGKDDESSSSDSD